ncbi:hypothetical protein RIF29_15762 [Crotalaria pallida]|uniref:Large ribosomal subunit protein bL32m n=1 Tax=Crotalaria pallida TaxID=3830 RepID=A0AAN9FJP0_CROPI
MLATPFFTLSYSLIVFAASFKISKPSLSFSIATILRRLRPSLRRNLRRLLHPPTAAAPFNHHTIPNRHNLQFSTGIDQLDSDQAHSAMAAIFAMLRGTRVKMGSILGFERCNHLLPQSPPLAGSIQLGVPLSPQPVLPELSSPSFSLGGSMELMAVPKKKVSPHKRGIRNGPKALKPIPVIVQCKSCGRVRLPHYYCCGGKPKEELGSAK